MAWQTPKTNWQAADVPLPDDFNRIEENVQELQNTKETPAGAQAKADAAETSAKSYADNIGTALSGIIGSLGSLLTTVKTNIVAAINSLKSELDAHKADYASHKAEVEQYLAEVPLWATGTATLPNTGWSGPDAQGYYSKSVTVLEITSNDNVHVSRIKDVSDSAAADLIQEAWNLIEEVVAGTNTLTFYTYAVPSVSVPFVWERMR